jgi:carbon-monoxide dehydrogenase large subunit
MGEGGAIAPPAAIANAVRDALAPLGAEVNETPLTPRRVLAAIRQAQASSQAPQAPSSGRGDMRPSSPSRGLP